MPPRFKQLSTKGKVRRRRRPAAAAAAASAAASSDFECDGTSTDADSNDPRQVHHPKYPTPPPHAEVYGGYGGFISYRCGGWTNFEATINSTFHLDHNTITALQRLEAKMPDCGGHFERMRGELGQAIAHQLNCSLSQK